MNYQIPTIFYDPISQPCKAIYWWAKNAGIKVNLKLTWLGKFQHTTPEFVKMNPMKQIPVLKHNDLILSESSAIIQYLAELGKVQEKWFGSDINERALVNQYLSWYHTNLRQKFTLDYYLNLVILPCFENHPQPPSKILDETIAKNTIVFEYMNKALENKKYFLGDKLTVVDFVFATEIISLVINKRIHDLVESHQNVKKWLKKMESVPYFQEVHETEKKYFHPCMLEYLDNKDSKKCLEGYGHMMEVEEKRLSQLEDYI